MPETMSYHPYHPTHPGAELVLPISTSNCSLDVSVLSMGSTCDSCSSFGSMDPPPKRKPSQDRLSSGVHVHRRRKSIAKYNIKGNNSNKSRWHNTVDAISSAGMTSAPFRKPSNPRLVHLNTHHHHHNHRPSDTAANLPCRKCSDPRLYKLVVDAPANAPSRKFSNPTPLFHLGMTEKLRQQQGGNAATAALNLTLNNGSSHSNSSSSSSGSASSSANFRWKTGSQFCAHPPSRNLNPLMGCKAQRNPPARPARKGSLMDFNLLSSWDSPSCTCEHHAFGHDDSGRTATTMPDDSGSSSNMMPPPLPARKESLMDFDDLSTSANSGCGHAPHYLGSPLGLKKFVTLTRESLPAVPRRRASILPPPPSKQHPNAAAPVIPARQESLMDLHDL